MEEPEREDGSASPKGCGAGGAAPRRPACRPPSPRGPRGRFTGLRGLPLLPRPPARRARLLQPPPPPPQPPRTPRPPRLSLRAARDQRPQRTRPPTANHRRGRDTSHTAELEAAASPTSRGARHSTGPRAGHAPSDVSGGEAGGGRTQSARAAEPPPAHLQSRPVRGLRFRKSERSPVTLSLLPYKGPPLCPGRAESAQGLLGVVVYPPEPSFPFSFPRPSWNYGVDGEVYSLAFHHKTDQLWNYCTQFSSLGTVFGVA